MAQSKTQYILIILLALSVREAIGVAIFQNSPYFSAFHLSYSNSLPIHVYSFPNKGPYNLTSVDLVLSGYDFSNLMMLQFGAQVSYDDIKHSFQILLTLYNKMQFYSLSYFIVAVSWAGSPYLGITSACITPNKNPFADFVNNGLIYLQASSPFYKTQADNIICIPMLKSIQSQVSDQYSYFNITQVVFQNNSDKIRISIYNNYSFLIQECLTFIFYHQTAASNDTFLAYTFSSFNLGINSFQNSNSFNNAISNNFNIAYQYGPTLQPKCFIGFQNYLLKGNTRQTLKFSLSLPGVTQTNINEQYELSYAYFCLAKIACESNNLQYYPTISDCQQPCNITNCLICSSSTSCSLCEPYYFINSMVRCSQCSSNCLNCSSSNKCNQCADGYFLKNSFCFICPLFCIKCTTSSCISCKNGYFSIGTGCVSCISVMPNCLSCLGPSICNNCATTYYYNSNQKGCVLCNTTIANCHQCNLPNNCLTCHPGFYLASMNKCSNCSHSIDACCNGYVANCVKCKSQAACLICSPAFFINSNFTCSSCIVYGANCTSCNSTSCIQCLNGYLLLKNQCVSCSSLLPNCQTCNSSKSCTSCKDSLLLVDNQCFNCQFWPLNNIYYLDEQNNCHPCSQIIPNCNSCNESTVCISCMSLYYIKDNICILCSNSIPQCLECLNDQICQLCSNKYYLSFNSTQCLQCESSIANCGQCNSKKNPITLQLQIRCQICFSQYFSNGVECNSCMTNMPFCLQCSSQSQCNVCSLGYYLNLNNLCVDCPTIQQGCKTCATKSTCSICLNQYFLQNQICKHCSTVVSNCISCSDTQNKSIFCNKCGGSFYLNSFLNCSKCSQKFAYCQICNRNNCVSCISSYYISQTNSCLSCSKAITNCVYCSSNILCLSCSKGFWLNTGHNSCDSCNNISRGCNKCEILPQKKVNCTQCLQGYALYVSSGFILSCIQCKVSIINCLSCSTPSVCLTCRNDSYLNQYGTCSLCSLYIPNCLMCLNTSQCLQCKQSFILMANRTCNLCDKKQFGVDKNNNSLCLSCNYVDSLVCTSCINSYYLSSQHDQCLSCSDAIKECASCASASVCIACLPGYYLASNNQRCISCSINNCQVCSNGKCDRCMSGNYMVEGSSCQSCNKIFVGCNSCSPTVCQICNDGYYLESGICRACSSVIQNCILCYSNTTCELKYTPIIPTPQNPYIKPIAVATIILSLFSIVVIVIWCRKQKQDQFILHEEIPKQQTDRRLTQDQVYTNQIELDKGKICQYCLINPSQVMRLQLLCSKCQVILKRGHKHKIRKDIKQREEIANIEDKLANQIALQLQSNINIPQKKKTQHKKQTSRFEQMQSKKANTKSTNTNSNSIRNMF